MKQSEILDHLRNGHVIKETKNLNFKYGKLQKGTSYSYTINDIMITSRQFDSIRDIIKRTKREPLQATEYSIKTI